MKSVFYKTHGTCSQYIQVQADENKRIHDIRIIGGCDGNLKGICTLVKGMSLEEVKTKFSGICCGNKETSCPDQIARAIEDLEKEY
jgi:uncharacterized protein (TIGR03905 family)